MKIFYNPRLDILAELQDNGLLLIDEPKSFMVLTLEWVLV